MHTMRIGLLLAAACLGGCAGQAGDSTSAAGSENRPTSTSADPDIARRDDGNATAPTPLEARLATLLVERPEDPVIEPRRDVSRPRQALPPDVRPGVLVIGRRASLQREPNSTWPRLTFHNGPGLSRLTPRRVLPNDLRERMEIAQRTHPGRPAFEVSGETTVFRGEGYLLLSRATLLAGDDSPQEPPRDARPTDQADGNEPGAPGADGNVPDAGRIMRELLRDRPARPAQLPDLSPDANAASASVLTVGPPDGGRPRTAVVDRLVYIEPTDPERPDGWWRAHLIGDNTLGEPPLRLLPCRLLERAMTISARPSPGRVRFRVSGLVTVYRGREYLLLRKLWVDRDVNQF